jgi:hypothetical protein
MREVIIKTFYREDGEYVVRFGNGTLHKFKSEKATKKFLADTNRFLSEFTYRCNSILTELYQHGREIWLISPDFKNPKDHELLEHFIKQVYDRSCWKEGNYFTFIDLRKFCEHAKSIIKTYRNVGRVSKIDTIRRYRLDDLFSRVQGLQIKLLNYGEAECFGMFSVAHIEDVSDVATKLRVA